MGLLIVSATLSIVINFLLQLKGLTLILAITLSTLMLAGLGNLFLNVISTPKLERSRTKSKPLHASKIRSAH